jgi:hypothetical protein
MTFHELVCQWNLLSFFQDPESSPDIVHLLLDGFGPSVVAILLINVECFLDRYEHPNAIFLSLPPITPIDDRDDGVQSSLCLGYHQLKAGSSANPCVTAYSAISTGYESFNPDSGPQDVVSSFRSTHVFHPLSSIMDSYNRCSKQTILSCDSR